MPHSIAIVGATGAVGEKMREVVESRRFPFRSIKFLASQKSAGKKIEFAGKTYSVEGLSAEAFRGIDIVLSSTPASVSKEWSPIAARAGAIVIDNSSAWRMDPEVPLVVPEVNPQALDRVPKGIIANPNCSTIQMVVVLKPLHDRAGLKRVVVATYQASSGKGATGLRDLDDQIRALGQGKPVPAAKAHAAQLAGNVISHDWKTGEEGYSEEEWKIMLETRKILGLPDLRITVTTARVPVRTGHSEAVNVELERPLDAREARDCLAKAEGITLLEQPMPLEAEGKDQVFVGRVREDRSVPHGLNLWIVADNLRKGAATNAVQIAELVAKRIKS